MLSPVEALQHLSGSATAAELVAVSGRREVRSAYERGDIVRLARGRYALPDAADPFVTASRLGGVVSHASAAQQWGLAVASRPLKPHVTVTRHRCRVVRAGAEVHWSDLGAHEIHGRTTTPLRTVLDCARTLPRGEGLAVADSALRLGLVGTDELRAAARGLRGAGRSRVMFVAMDADARAASALESLMRAVVLHAGITGFEPQLQISGDGFSARVDLGHRSLRIVLEADSFEHHGHRSALVRDCRRYDELVVRGWLVLRFAWEHVVGQPEWVAEMVRAAVLTRHTGWQK
ncbi:MAG TPA: DUF559 domain-containing protein [Actinomycetales bacterium]